MAARGPSTFLPESPEQSLRNLIGEVLRARAEPERFIGYFHQDAVFHMIGRRCDYAFSGVYRGRADILDLCRRIDTEVELSDHRILNLVIEDGRAALRRSVVVRYHASSARERLIIGNLVKFRGQRVTEVFEYSDTAWLKRLAGVE